MALRGSVCPWLSLAFLPPAGVSAGKDARRGWDGLCRDVTERQALGGGEHSVQPGGPVRLSGSDTRAGSLIFRRVSVAPAQPLHRPNQALVLGWLGAPLPGDATGVMFLGRADKSTNTQLSPFF